MLILKIFIFDCSFAVQVWQMVGLWNEVTHAVLTTNLAIDAIFCCCKLYHRNMLNIWQAFFGVSRSIKILNFGGMKMNCVQMLL